MSYFEEFEEFEEDDDLDEFFYEEDDDLEEFEEDDDLDDAIAMEFAGIPGDAAEGRRARRRARKRAAARRAAAAQRAARKRSVAAAKSTKSFRARISKTYATQKQLQATSSRLDRKIAINGRGIKKVNARVNALKGKHARDTAALKNRMDRHADAIRKDRAKLKKSIDKVRKDSQMAMLLPMMMQPDTVDLPQGAVVGGATNGVPLLKATKLATVGDNSMSMMLPLMMMADGEGGGDNNMMMLALMMSMGK